MVPVHTLVARPAIPEEGVRIAFLCGCAEPGRDGVGDYTALLAEECARRGCAVLRIALNDAFVTGAVEAEGVLRMGPAMDWERRVDRAREAVDAFGADAVSLQWVPYAFHARGVPWGIDKGLARIAGGRPAQVMCHEIWLGAEERPSLKHRLVGAAQRAAMRRVFRELRPGCVQTSNAAYMEALWSADIESEVLPMFGSIPIVEGEVARDASVARFGMFGTLHPVWPPEPLLGRLRGLGKRVEISHMGRIGSGEALWREMERRYGTEFDFKRHGEQPATRVARFFLEVDYGLATTPLALIGKSATAAAMLEHGLPVIVNRDDVRYAGAERKPPGVITMDERFIGALKKARRATPRRRLPEVADQFLDGLRRARAATA